MTNPNRIERTTVANAETNARLAPIPRAHYELPGWITVVGGIVCAVAVAVVADPMLLGFALPAFAVPVAKVLMVVGGFFGLAGSGVKLATPAPLARLPVESLTVAPMQPRLTPEEIAAALASRRPSLRPLQGPRDDAPIPFENDGGDGAK